MLEEPLHLHHHLHIYCESHIHHDSILSAMQTVVALLSFPIGLILALPAASTPQYTRDGSLSENENELRANEGKYKFRALEYVYMVHLSIYGFILLYYVGKCFYGSILLYHVGECFLGVISGEI